MQQEKSTLSSWVRKNPRTVILLTGMFLLLMGFIFIGDIFTPILIGFLLAYILEPVIEWLVARKVRRTFGVSLIYIVLFAAVVSLFTFLTPKVIEQTRRLYGQISSLNLQTDMQKLLNNETSTAEKTVAASAEEAEATPDTVEKADTQEPPKSLVEKAAKPGESMRRLWRTVREYTAKNAETLAGRISSLFVAILQKAITGVTSLARFFFGLIVVLVFGFFFMLYFPHIKKELRRSLPEQNAANILPILKRIDNAVSNFFRGRLIVCIISGIVCSIGLRIAGINYWLLLGLASGILGFIPIIGVLITFVPACAFAVLTPNPMLALTGVVLTYAIVQMVVEPLIGTLIISHEVKMHPALVIFAMLLGGRLFGLLGVILSIPAAAAIKVIVLYYTNMELQAGIPEPAEKTE